MTSPIQGDLDGSMMLMDTFLKQIHFYLYSDSENKQLNEIETYSVVTLTFQLFDTYLQNTPVQRRAIINHICQDIYQTDALYLLLSFEFSSEL